MSTLNRQMCIDLSTCGYQPVCFVPDYSNDELEDAGSYGVRLVRPRDRDKVPQDLALFCPPDMTCGRFLPDPDYVIGHGHITGWPAWLLTQNHFRDARFVYFVHTIPGELAPYKALMGWSYGVDARDSEDVALIGAAHAVVGVGPRLCRHARSLARTLNDGRPSPPVFDYVPRIDADPVPHEAPERPMITLQGRLDDEHTKGVPLMLAALSELTQGYSRHPQVDLRLRGLQPVSPDEAAKQWRKWTKATGGRIHIDRRDFTTSVPLLRMDRRQSTLMVMPSAAEGFGLTGLEAMAEGVPCLIGSRSGLAEWLMAQASALSAGDRAVLQSAIVDDSGLPEGRATVWARRMDEVLTDPPGAFARAQRIRHLIAAGHGAHRCIMQEIDRDPSDSGPGTGSVPDPHADRLRGTARSAKGAGLSVEEIGKRTGGALIVYLAPGDRLLNGRPKVNDDRLDDRTVLWNMEGVWQIGRLRERFIERPALSPKVLAGVYGPPDERRIIGAARIDIDGWDDPGLDDGGGLFRVPISDRTDLDVAGLKGQPVPELRFGRLAWQFFIWVDGDGVQQHPALLV